MIRNHLLRPLALLLAFTLGLIINVPLPAPAEETPHADNGIEEEAEKMRANEPGLAGHLQKTEVNVPGHSGTAAGKASGALAPQRLDYTEDPVDVPNPDRGFYRANDGMVVPVHGAGTAEMEVGREPVTVGGPRSPRASAMCILT